MQQGTEVYAKFQVYIYEYTHLIYIYTLYICFVDFNENIFTFKFGFVDAQTNVFC